MKYPFSEATKEIAKWLNFDLASADTLLLDRAKQRAIDGIESGRVAVDTKTKGERFLIIEILSYPLAKIMITKTKDKFLIGKYAEAEANSFRNFLMGEPDDVVGSLAREFGFDVGGEAIPFTDYLKYLPRDEEYKLVNSQMKLGKVRVGREAIANLLPEKLKAELEKSLRRDIDVPPVFDTYAGEIKKEVNRDKAFRTKEDFGVVEVGHFPPCIKALISDAQSGEPMAHQPRFVLASFLANVGMPVEQIAELFSNTPNYNAKKTRYYIEYTMGKRGSGTKYSPPSCEKMVFYGLCRGKDTLCSRLKHPLKYYSLKKRGNRHENKA